MSFNIRKIANAVTVAGPTGPSGEHQEFSFEFEDPDWKTRALTHIADNKSVIADQLEQRATDEINRIETQLQGGTNEA